MGIKSNPDFLLSGKDLTNVSMICNSISNSHDQEDMIKKEEEESSVFPALKIKLPSFFNNGGGIEDQEEEEEEEEDGYRTPTSEEHKIPVIFICPPAPRAPKSKPIKRKLSSGTCRRNLILDFSCDIEGIFSRPADLGGIVKKVKRS